MRRCLALIAMAAGVFLTSAWAQYGRAEIQFRYHVGELVMYPGTYDVFIGRPHAGTITLISRSTGNDMSATALVHESETLDRAKPAKLVFNKYGNGEYFLSQICDPYYPTSLKLRKSEHEIVTSRLITGLQPERVVVWAALLHR